MLMNAQDLVSLQLKLPTSRGSQDLALSSVHGRLRSLSFHGSSLTGEPITGQASTKDFLKRHPEIKYLDLCTQTTLELDDEDLPNLCVVSVDHTTLDAVPNLFSPTAERPVKALRLTQMPHLTTNTVFTLTSAVARTLKFLHLDSSIFSFRANLSYFADLLHTLPELVELRLGAESSCAFQLQHKLCEQDLVQYLKTLTDESAPSLQAISFVDSRGKQLTQLCINKLPPTPPSLKHIAWDVSGTRYLYEIVEKSHSASRAVLVNESPSKVPRLWIQESVMDHFGTEVDGW
ncbi:hypothetical protein EIP86_000465 [Pleurotus ostreatoroseus]|nr:hypothetical protein EIP86_000465 [Pleurotus ostreatoroseus]